MGECLRLGDENIPTFDLGYDRSASKASGHAVGVRAGGPADRAGLREGERILGTNIWSGFPEKEVELEVDRNGARAKIRYLPQGAMIRVPQYRFDEKAWKKDPAKCRSVFLESAGKRSG